MSTHDPLDDWDFELPDDRIARHPAQERSQSRLMVIRAGSDAPAGHHRFAELPRLLGPGDLLVANDSRVMRSRLRGTRATGGAVELVLLGPGPGPVEAIARPARKLRQGDVITLSDTARATVVEEAVDGIVRVAVDPDPVAVMEALGEPPLPPYLGRAAEPSDLVRYQTVFSGPLGSAAAPTAGLHFDPPLVAALASAGIGLCTVTLHVGIGTFRPLRSEDLAGDVLHPEAYHVSEEVAERIAATRRAGGRIIAVGTTSARTLESATPEGQTLPLPGRGVTRLFVRPGYPFRSIDGLITNFHLPRSSLLMLVAALIGRERLLAAYAEAIALGYRFYSYGDAMLVLGGRP